MPLPLVYHPAYSFEFSSKHRFPMAKFKLLYEYLKQQGIVRDNNIFRPGPCPDRLLALAHCEDYIQRFTLGMLTPKELRRLGLPWSEDLVKRTKISPAGTVLTTQLALQQGIACHLAGGTHHAFYNAASGFCILNDLAIAAKTLTQQAGIDKVLIYDCDVHQGDGTATILQDDAQTITCSLHCEKNFPAKKAQSDWDIALPPNTTDAVYLDTVKKSLKECLSTYKPDIVIYDAGVDIFIDDPLGLLSVSLDGIRRRDANVLETCIQNNTPVATVIGGGYDKDHQALAMRHAIIVEEAERLYQQYFA